MESQAQVSYEQHLAERQTRALEALVRYALGWSLGAGILVLAAVIWFAVSL